MQIECTSKACVAQPIGSNFMLVSCPGTRLRTTFKYNKEKHCQGFHDKCTIHVNANPILHSIITLYEKFFTAAAHPEQNSACVCKTNPEQSANTRACTPFQHGAEEGGGGGMKRTSLWLFTSWEHQSFYEI